MTKNSERGFEDLDCYQLAQRVLKEAYRVANSLPSFERYNLSDQLRRAAASVTLNIAEGYGRYHYLDKLRFLYIARGSLYETLSGFVGCEAVGYISEAKLAENRALCHRAGQALNGYIRFTHRQRQGHKEYGDQALREPEILYAARADPEPPDPELTDSESTDE